MSLAQYTLRAEARAVENGHRAVSLNDGRYRVVSDTHADVDYVVQPTLRPGMPLAVACSCPSGQNRRRHLVPCWHAAIVARRLEREHQVVWRAGSWHCSEAATAVVDDPFVGLAGPQLDGADAIARIKAGAA